MSGVRASNARAADYLALSSLLRKRVQADGVNPAVLLVEDSKSDAYFIELPLRRLLGDGATIEIVHSVKAIRASLESGHFDVIVLDDHMDGGARAEATLQLIRLSQATVPVIVVSHLLTRLRKSQLSQLGLAGVFEKEDLTSVVLGKAILAAIGHPIT
jgi:CheY-like chemotaxis protein